MRTLVIMRGAPGAGKSTWIKEHNMEQYTICPDELRLLHCSPQQSADGGFQMTPDMEVEKQIWNTLFQVLEFRMARGEFTIIDATASKTKDIQRYKELADQYRYRMYCLDFTDVPLETCLRQNKLRPSWKWVPDEAIENIYARFATQKVPAGVTVVKPEDFESIYEKPFDLSTYNKVVFIGDQHGCYDTLMQYFKNGLADDTAYIFCGDEIDRGNQNAEIMHYFYSIMDKPNVCFLEGNHSRWLRDYGNSAPAKSREFETRTKKQLIEGKFTEKMARMFYRKVRQMSHFTFNGLEILACHGGIPNLAKNLLFIPSTDFIKGTGNYKDYKTIADTWMRDTASNQFLVHGHRNVEKDDVQIAERVFNLEGGVEFGGKLRIVELNKDLTWNIIELDNCQPVSNNDTEARVAAPKVETVEEAVAYLRDSKFVQEKVLGDGISSFNFTREAFYLGNWTDQTILARGLFIDTVNNKIMARSYEKFFKINEVRATELAALRNRLQFPVTAYVKENGFLGIVSYDYNKDSLFIATKSSNQGDYVDYFKELFKPYYAETLSYLRTCYNTYLPTTLVFEVIDIKNDPHIIKYDDSKIVLLDAISNTLNFKTIPYEYLRNTASRIGCTVKERAVVLKDWEAFSRLYREAQDEDYQYNNSYIEGFVFVDAAGFMVKCKTGYYNLWKKLRGVADRTLRTGYITKTSMLVSSVENFFYGFLKSIYELDRDKTTKTYPYETDIISLRDKFYNQKVDSN